MATTRGSIAMTLLIASALGACGSGRTESVSVARDSAEPSSRITETAQDVVGRWRAELPDTDNYQELVLKKDHEIAGYDGCNSVVGTWSDNPAGQRAVSVDINRQSYKACPKLAAANLSSAATASVVDGRLRLLDATGSLLATL